MKIIARSHLGRLKNETVIFDDEVDEHQSVIVRVEDREFRLSRGDHRQPGNLLIESQSSIFICLISDNKILLNQSTK